MPSKLNTLFRNTDTGRKKRADKVSIQHVKTYVSKKNFSIKEYVYKTGTDKLRYRTTMRPINPMQYDLNNGNASALVSCSCKDFLFRIEYALTQGGNSEIKYSNGQPANVTNPTNKKYMCKHLVAIFDDVLGKNKENVMDLDSRKMAAYIKRETKKSISPLQDIVKSFDNKTRG